VRALSGYAAVTCENAISKRCQCRCQGMSHGKSRSMLAEFFEQLAEDDPHKIPEKSKQLPLPAPIGARYEA